MTKKNIALLEFEGNPNIGIYMFANDKFCLLGRELPEEKKKEIEKVLNVPVYDFRVLNTELVGVYVSGNNEFLITPELYETERNKIQEILKKHEMTLIELPSKTNTMGNSVLVGDNTLILNPNFETKIVNKLMKETKFEVLEFHHDLFTSSGSIILYFNGKYLVSQELDEDVVKPILDKVVGVASVNKGSPFLTSGIIVNKNGILLGSECTTVEIQNIVESLGMI